MPSKGEPGRGKARRDAAGERAEPSAANAFSRIVEVDEIAEGDLPISIRADAAERAGIARNAGLIAVESLEADLEVAKHGGDKFSVAGALRARIVQTCVVSLEPFESEIQAEIAVDFAAEPKKQPARRGRAAQRTESPDVSRPSRRNSTRRTRSSTAASISARWSRNSSF